MKAEFAVRSTHASVLKYDLFSLYVLLPHFGTHDGTLENHCFQILKYVRVCE